MAVSREVSREGPGESPGGESPPPSEASPFAGTDSESGAGAEERRSRATHARATHARTTPRTTTRSGSRTFSRIATDGDRPSNHLSPSPRRRRPARRPRRGRAGRHARRTGSDRRIVIPHRRRRRGDRGGARTGASPRRRPKIEEPTEPAAEIEESTAAAETESEARIRLIRARVDMVRVDANRRARLSPVATKTLGRRRSVGRFRG